MSPDRPQIARSQIDRSMSPDRRILRRRKSDKLMREMKAIILQQVESHLLKVSLIRLSYEIRRKGLDVRIVACIHDSIWVETAAAEAEVGKIMGSVMTRAMSLSVPREVDIG